MGFIHKPHFLIAAAIGNRPLTGQYNLGRPRNFPVPFYPGLIESRRYFQSLENRH
jgi:hypothetical protein